MCSFTVLLKPIQASAAFERGSPSFGKLFPLCVSADMICQIQKLIWLETATGGEKMWLDQFPIASGDTEEEKATCGQEGEQCRAA